MHDERSAAVINQEISSMFHARTTEVCTNKYQVCLSEPFGLTIHTPLMLGTPPLSSGPTWARAVQARGRYDGHPKWYMYGMRQHCCRLFSCSSLFTPSSSPGDSWHGSSPCELTERSLLAEPGSHPRYRCAWESYAVGGHLTPLEHTGPCTPRRMSEWHWFLSPQRGSIRKSKRYSVSACPPGSCV